MKLTRPAPCLTTLCFLFAVLLGASSSAYAQFETATVLGSVRDAAGAAIPGAKITLKNTATGITANAMTDGEGNYQFFNVKIGDYQVTAELQGFASAVAENVVVTVNARQRVDLSLRAGAVTDTVVITDAAPLLESDSSDRGQVIDKEQIVNLPLNGRSYADLALLAPGVRASELNTPDSGGRDASFNVNGLRSSFNNFALDGIDNNSYGTSNQGFSNQVIQPSPDAVAQFKVQTNNFSAEFGRAGGAVINASLRSGTNKFHGTVYDYLRNTALNATGFFKPTPRPGELVGEKPTLIQNQFGFTVGGPIVRDRTFFFVNYEGYRRITKTLTFATLPTLDQRQGRFGVPVRNPLTGVVYSNGVIPADQITRFARQVFADLPLPNNAQVTNNYENLPRSQFFNDKGDLKIDHNFNPRMTMFARISQRKLNNFEAPVIGGPTGSGSNAYVRVLNQQLAVGFTYSLTPSSLIEVRLGISRTKAGKTPAGIGGPSLLELYGIGGLPTDPAFAGGLNTQSIGGYTALGRQTSNPQFQHPFIVNPRINYTFILGRHSLKAGYEYQAINTEIEDFHPKYGQDTYSGQFSRPSGAANNIFNIADFLFGARSQYELNNLVVVNYRQRMHFGYLQDDFKVSQKLTLNLGLRYEFATPQYERDNRLVNFDPDTKTLIQAKDGSLADRALVNPDRNNFAPRLGLAYNILPRTVLRAGYGVSYIHFNRLGGENLLAYNGPNVVNAIITQQVSQGFCTGNNFVGCFRTTQQGYPEGLTAPERFNPLTARVNFTPKDARTSYLQGYHLTIQRQLTRNLLLDVAYTGNRSTKLIILGDYNQARPNNASDPTAGTPLQQRRPIAGYSFIQISFPGGVASYNALQIKLERRATNGLYLLNSFTFGKAIDNVAGHLESFGGDNSRANIRNLAADKAVSSYNQKFNNTTSIVYALPFGRGRKAAASFKPVDLALGGWRVTLINTMTSGLPINLVYGPAAQFVVGTSLAYRPNLVGDPLTPSDQRSVDNYLNPAAVAIPTDRSQPFGSAGRNIVVGPSLFTADLGLHKSFAVFGEGKRLEFRAEAFNVLNHTNFRQPNGNRSSIAYGTIRSAFPARQIQFALKFLF